MSDETTNPDGAETAPESVSGKPDKANRDAARYRTERNQLRDELAKANQVIERYQRAEVERLASELAEPSDVFTLSGRDLADFLSESGDIDSEAVAEAVAGILASRPGMRKPQRATDPSQGTGGKPGAPGPSWSDLLKPA